jgi:uncharacterized protein
LNRQAIISVLKEQKELVRRFSIQNIYIFGSAARDQATNLSDVDLLVEFAEDALVSLFQFARLRRELSRVLNCNVDLVTPDALHEKSKEEILSGVTVFGALDHGKDFEMLHLNTAAASIDNDDVTEQKEAFIQH